MVDLEVFCEMEEFFRKLKLVFEIAREVFKSVFLGLYSCVWSDF